jgi:hypothetical protein
MSKMNDAELRRRLELLASVQPSPEATGRAMDRVRRTILETEGQQARKSLGRILMNSKWSKLAVAAAVVIAVLLGLHFLGNPLGSNLSFAQVIQPILNANMATFDIILGVEEPNTPVIHDMVMGSRIRRILSNAPNAVNIIDLEQGKILTLVDEKKEAIYTNLKGINVPNYMEQLKNLVVMLQNSPHFDVENLGVREIDGREVVGFLAKHPKVEITIWADTATGLPVRIEQKQQGATYTVKNMRFDVPLNESLFSLEAPEGYKSRQIELDVNSATEADFVEGLRTMAEVYGDGQFPDSVAVGDFLKQLPAIEKKGKALGLSDEEDTALGKKLQLYLTFLEPFKGEGKWYYRGKGVKLGEADKAIFWYRPKGSKTYHVIYGDLHVEDVTRENLPEPLAADDVFEPIVGYQQWSKPEFVGSQEDYWYVVADGRAQVKAMLTLMKGPKDTSLMPIKLPYANAPLEAVLLSAPGRPAQDFVALPFHKTGEGTYNIKLPLDKLAAGQTMLICQWHVSLDQLKFEQGNYLTTLQSLIPVISYKLKVGVDPNSGFELTVPATDTWATPFTGNAVDKPTTQFGRCGLLIGKRQ